MSPTVETLCCAPVLLLWFGPLAVVVFGGVFDGCARLVRLFGRRLEPPLGSGSSP